LNAAFGFWNSDASRLIFDPALFLYGRVSIALEVDPKSARIFAFAAVREERSLVHKGSALDPALDRLEAFCNGAVHLVGALLHKSHEGFIS